MQILLVCLLNMDFTLRSWAALHTSYLEGKLIHIYLRLKPAIAVRKTSTSAPRQSWLWWRRRSATMGRSTRSCSPSSPASSSSSQAFFVSASSSISSHCRLLPDSLLPRQSPLPAVRWNIALCHTSSFLISVEKSFGSVCGRGAQVAHTRWHRRQLHRWTGLNIWVGSGKPYTGKLAVLRTRY